MKMAVANNYNSKPAGGGGGGGLMADLDELEDLS